MTSKDSIKFLNRKIVFLLPDMEIGGIEINTLNFCNNLINKLANVTIIYERLSNQNLKKKFDERVNLIDMGSSKMRHLLWKYRNIFQKESPDFVVTSSFTILFNLFLARILLGQNFKIIFKIETNFKEYLSNKNFFLILYLKILI